MRYLFLILSFILISAAAFSQEKDSIYTIVEEMPRFPGCENMEGTLNEKKKCAEREMLRYIFNNIRYSHLGIDSLNIGSHFAVVSFVVEKDGCVNGVKLIRGENRFLNDAYINVLSEMPCWIAGKHQEEPVAVRFNLPIRIKPSY